jgi:hypothetical protein
LNTTGAIASAQVLRYRNPFNTLIREEIMMMTKFLSIGTIVLCFVLGASAQGDRKAAQARLKQYFEGRRVILKVDMPAARSGIDVSPEKPQQVDFSKIAKHIGEYGISLRTGDRPVVTEVEVSKDEIEFQLDGGGYGSPADSSAEPSVPSYPSNTRRQYEKDIEQELKTATDSNRIKYLRKELDRERDRRDREYRRDLNDYNRAKEYRDEYVREKRPTRGSRFNLKFKQTDTSTITPEQLMRLLADYVDFSTISGGSTEYSENTSVEAPASTSGKPYLGDWRNGRGEVLQIDNGILQFGRGPGIEYREVFRMAAARVYAVELLGSQRGGMRRFISIVTGNREIKLSFYDTLEDLQNGRNVKGEETWSK